MPQEEIEAAQEKVRQELPYIRALEDVDQLKQKYESNNKIAALTYKFMESIKGFSQNLKDRFSSKDNLMLEAPDMLIQQKNEGMYEQSKDKEETKREKFLNELSNNGQYREQVENTMLMQDQSKKEVLETKDIER